MLSRTLPWHKLGLPEGRAGNLPGLKTFYGDAWPYLSTYFLPTQRLVSSVDCPKPGGPGCPRQVVEHSFHDIVAVCGNSPRECDPIKLARRDVIIHELKIEKLLSNLAHLLQLKGAAAEIVMPLTWTLGMYAVPGRPVAAVYVSFQSGAEELQVIGITLLNKKEKPFVFLVPSRDFCPVSLAVTMRSAGAYLVGLDELQHGERAADDADLLRDHVFTELAAAESDKENCFRLEKDYWQIRFRVKRWSIKQSVGIQYITRLMQKAYDDGCEIHVADLYYLVKGRPAAEDTELNKLRKEQLLEMSLDVTGLGDGLDLMTPEGKQWARSQLLELAERIEEAQEYGHAEEALRLREKKEALEDHVRKAHGVSGRIRKSSDPNERMRKSIGGAIRNCLKKMGSRDGDPLAVYLDSRISTGIFCSFQKDSETDWEIHM